MKLNKKVMSLIMVGSIIVTNSVSILYINNNHKNEIENINNNHKKIEEEYQKEVLDLKNEIVELKNKDANKYKKFNHPDEVELSAGYYEVGKDVKAGTYDIVHIEGQGLVGVNDENWYQIGTNKDWGDTEKVENVELKEGDKIEVTSGLTFRFVPVEK